MATSTFQAGPNIQARYGAVIVLPQSATFTAESTYNNFIDNASEGDVGAFKGVDPFDLLAGPSAGDTYFLAQKTAGGVIKHATFTKGTLDVAMDHVAQVKQITTVTVTVAAVERGQSYILKLQNTSNGTLPNESESIEFVTVTGSETAAQIATALYNAWVAKKARQLATSYGTPTQYVITNPSPGVLSVTTTNFNHIFDANISIDDELVGGTVVVATPFVQGFGYGEQVFEYERKGDVHDGIFSTMVDVRDDLGKQAQYTIKGKSYDAISLISNQGSERRVGNTFNKNQFDATLMLFIETDTVGATGSTAYTNAKAALL